MATSSKTSTIPPLFKADTAAFEPEVSWCPEQRKSVGRRSVLELNMQRSHRWPGGPIGSGHRWRAYAQAQGGRVAPGMEARTPIDRLLAKAPLPRATQPSSSKAN